MELAEIIDAIGVEPYHQEEAGVIYCADCMAILPKIPDGSIDLVLTDIPYGEVNRPSNGLRRLDKGDADTVTFCLSNLIVLLLLVCRGSLYVFCGSEQVSEVRRRFVQSNLSTRHGYWEKDNPSPQNGEHIYLSATENVVFGKSAGAVFNAYCRKAVWHHPTLSNQAHPTEKPLAIIKDMVSTSSNVLDIVCDPFLGSGTTAVAAKQLGRKFIGIEINRDYADIAVDRLRQGELF